MRLTSGSRLGPYEVVGPLGAGGMGEVYRARDARLGRDVALKVLPQDLAGDQERLARFSREAQVLASLNHPGIAAIYGVEEAGDTRALVLELVEGPTLAERLAQGPMPVDEAIAAAIEVATAIEAAHEHGIVHRDLKPANIKLRPDGAVKVLDFGLAKALALDPASTPGLDVTHSPTITAHATRAGIVLGTAAYMAPEQAKGKAVDRRADIWAYGAVLYEMLSGRRLFDGETPSEVLAAVILKEPDLSALPAATPPRVRHLIARCLEKDPKLRLRDIGEARVALADPGRLALPAAGAAGAAGVGITAGPGAAAAAGRQAGRRTVPLWVAAAAGAALLAALGLLVRGPGIDPAPVARFDVRPPPKASLDLINRPALAIARDGSMLAFAATSDGVAHLYLRRRADGEARLLSGTDGASNPVFSPDGRWIAFFAGNELKKTSLDGTVIGLAPVNDPRGLAWVDDGRLVYSPEAIGPVQMISADGGTPRAVSALDSERDERSHRWPEALPGGRTILFTVGTVNSPDNYDAAAIDAVDLETGARRTVLQGASMARYVPSGHLIFARAGVLYVVPFDAGTLATRGNPAPMVREVATDTPTGAAHYSCSDDGTLVYVPGGAQGGRMVAWVGRDGAAEPIDLPVAAYNDIRVSPDGTRAVVARGYTGSADIWIYDFARRTFSRLTFDTINGTPVFSGDGTHVLYASIDPRGPRTRILRLPADGSGAPATVAEFPTRVFLGGGPRDGRALILAYGNLRTGGKTDVHRLALEQGAKPLVITATQFDEYTPAASPDGRWVAYQSDDSGRDEVYVRDGTGAGGRWQVSTNGGEEPVWAADGRELFYRSGNRMMAVPITPGPRFEMGAPRMLFEGVYRMRSDSGVSYDVDPKGSRFLMIRPAGGNDPEAGIRVVLNWLGEVRRTLDDRR